MKDTKFRYMDKVKVVKGFYRGNTGKAISYYTREVGLFNKVKTHCYIIEMDNMEPDCYDVGPGEQQKYKKRLSFKDFELETA